MTDAMHCEFCGRPLKGEPEKKVLRGKEYTFCTEFCFRLFLYDAPKMSFEELKSMYALRFISMNVPDLHELTGE
jgi:hypothetical protein